MRKITQYKILVTTSNKPDEPVDNSIVDVSIWEHNGNRIEVTHNPKAGFFAFFNNDRMNFGRSKPDDPLGIILWVLERLGFKPEK